MSFRSSLFAAPLCLALAACSTTPPSTTAAATKTVAPVAPVAPLAALASPAPQASRTGGGVDVPVPTTCTPAVNQKLETMIQANSRNYTENVMACGIAQKTTVNHGGEHGSHHIITVVVILPTLGQKLIQIAINDSLDGPISARSGQSVFAFGQGYIDSGPWVAGIHDVHCSTHPTADNGWVVVNGVKTPTTCPSS